RTAKIDVSKITGPQRRGRTRSSQLDNTARCGCSGRMAEQTVEKVRIDGGVVVGLDSSASAAQALVLAVQEARLRGAVLNVLRAWSIRTAPRPADVPTQVMPS